MITTQTTLSGAALAVATLALLLSGKREPTPSLPPPGDPALQQRLDQLAQEVADLRRSVTAPPPPRADTDASVPAPERELVDDQLRQRLAQLEQRASAQHEVLAAVRRKVLPSEEDLAVIAAEKEQRQAASRQEWTAQFVDLRETEEVRRKALSELRFAGSGARDGAVADAAIQLVQTSTNAATRADVWRQMSGARNEALVPHLVSSLQLDPDARVREEAAETLGDYPQRTDAAAALRAASEQDPDEKVRRQALRSLGDRR